MNLKQLPYVVAIDRCGSLSAAARALQISQPALSKYLLSLEKEIGLPLFIRHKKKLYPTRAGQLYIDAAKKMIRLQEQTVHSIQRLQGHERKKLYIGGTPHRGAELIAKIYPEFVRRFPHVELVIVEGYASQLRSDVRSGKMTMAMTTFLNNEQSDLKFLPLYDEEILLSVPVFHPIAQSGRREDSQLPVIDVSEFQDTPFVMMGPETTIGAACGRLFADAGITPTTVYTSNNVLMVVELIRSGAGVGFIPSYYATPSKDTVYFRLAHPCHITSCFVSTQDHVFTEEERYIIYLQMRHEVKNIYKAFQWSDLLIDIIDEFEKVSPLPTQ